MRVTAMYGVVLAIGGVLGRRSVAGFLVWLVVATLAILVHELGHAVMGQVCRLDPIIFLHAMGGLTSWTNRRSVGWRQDVAISLAGPGVGFIVGYAVYRLSETVLSPVSSALLRQAMDDFTWVTLVWGVFNLLPILPLDGGHAVSAILGRVLGTRGWRISLTVSIVVAVPVTLLALMANQWWAAYLTGSFGYQNYLARRGAIDAPRINVWSVLPG